MSTIYPSDEIPLVVAPSKNDGNYTLFCYKEVDSKPKLQKYQLDQVPDHLRDYVVSYQLAPIGEDNRQQQRPYTHNPNLPLHLRNLTVIDSTYSGAQKSSEIYFSILQHLLNAFDMRHVYVSTTSAQTIPNHAKSFSSSSTVIFLAGDTSIHEFVNSLIKTTDNPNLYIAAVPTGTGNALSASLGHDSIASAISRIFTGVPSPLTNFKVEFPNGSVLVNHDNEKQQQIKSLQSLVVTSWGFHAALVADSDSPEYRKLGASRFQKAAMENLNRDQKYQGTIKYGKSCTLDGPHSYVLFTPVSKLEKTFTISPHSSPNNFNLHLVQFNQLPGDQIMEIMQLAYAEGSHVKDQRVVYEKLTNDHDNDPVVASIEMNGLADVSQHRWCVDGQIINVGACDDDNAVRIFRPTSAYNGWKLFIVT